MMGRVLGKAAAREPRMIPEDPASSSTSSCARCMTRLLASFWRWSYDNRRLRRMGKPVDNVRRLSRGEGGGIGALRLLLNLAIGTGM